MSDVRGNSTGNHYPKVFQYCHHATLDTFKGLNMGHLNETLVSGTRECHIGTNLARMVDVTTLVVVENRFTESVVWEDKMPRYEIQFSAKYLVFFRKMRFRKLFRT